MELLADRDPEEACRLLDPVLECMMAAVHRYEGTVNQVLGDDIMALFGAPIAHEDHAVRACYAALAMQEMICHYSEEVQTWPRLPLRWWGIPPTHLHPSSGRCLPQAMMPKCLQYKIRIWVMMLKHVRISSPNGR
jgi:hypothetical protein